MLKGIASFKIGKQSLLINPYPNFQEQVLTSFKQFGQIKVVQHTNICVILPFSQMTDNIQLYLNANNIQSVPTLQNFNLFCDTGSAKTYLLKFIEYEQKYKSLYVDPTIPRDHLLSPVTKLGDFYFYDIKSFEKANLTLNDIKLKVSNSEINQIILGGDHFKVAISKYEVLLSGQELPTDNQNDIIQLTFATRIEALDYLSRLNQNYLKHNLTIQEVKDGVQVLDFQIRVPQSEFDDDIRKMFSQQPVIKDNSLVYSFDKKPLKASALKQFEQQFYLKFPKTQDVEIVIEEPSFEIAAPLHCATQLKQLLKANHLVFDVQKQRFRVFYETSKEKDFQYQHLLKNIQQFKHIIHKKQKFELKDDDSQRSDNVTPKILLDNLGITTTEFIYKVQLDYSYCEKLVSLLSPQQVQYNDVTRYFVLYFPSQQDAENARITYENNKQSFQHEQLVIEDMDTLLDQIDMM